MRKLLAILLLLCLLTACGTTTPTEPPTATPTQAPTATPTKTTPIFTLPETATLPPRETLPPVERYTAEPRYSFVPADDYGEIYPYCGRFVESLVLGISGVYGFVDREGRIVCDPFYYTVQRLEGEYGSIYMAGYGAQDDGQVGTAFIAIDGSWCVVLEQEVLVDEMWQYLPYFDGKKWGAMDWNGKLILPCSYNLPVYVSDGMIVVPEIDGNRLSVSYTKLTGEVIVDPILHTLDLSKTDWGYSLSNVKSMAFSEGLASFCSEEGKYGYINTSGDVVIPAVYDYAGSFTNGTAYVRKDVNEHTDSMYINKKGEVVEWDTGSYSYEIGYDIWVENQQIINRDINDVLFSDWDGDMRAMATETAVFVYNNSRLMTYSHTGELVSTIQLENNILYFRFIIHNGQMYAYYVRGSSDSSVVINEQGQIITEKIDTFYIYGDYILVKTAKSTGLVDFEGNWFIQILIDQDVDEFSWW